MTSWFDGGIQRFRKNRGVSPDQPHRARLGTAQDIVKDKDREKRIGAHFETQGLQLRFLASRSGSIEPVQIEIHRDVSARDDHFFQSSGLPFRAFPGDCGAEFPELLLKSKSSGSVK